MKPTKTTASRLGLFAILVWVIAGVALPAAVHAQPTNPPTSTYTYDKSGKLRFCMTIPPEHSGFIFGIEFSGSWAPDKTTALDQFSAPEGWSWDVDPSGAWRATSKTAMVAGKEYCFAFPQRPGTTMPNPVTLTGTDANRHPIITFTSDYVQPVVQNPNPAPNPAPNQNAGQGVLAWKDSGINLGNTSQPLCLDPSHPGTILVDEEGSGTVAYNLETGKRTVISSRRFDLCGQDGTLYSFAGQSGQAWRFTASDPAGRSLDHSPTFVAHDASQMVYSFNPALPGNDLRPYGTGSLWASSDDGNTWQLRSQQFGGTLESVAVENADARVLYGVTTDRAGGSSVNGKVSYTIYASSDAGVHWERDFSGETDGAVAWGGANFTLEPVEGYGSPVTAVQLSVNNGAPGSGNQTDLLVSTDGAKTFYEAGLSTFESHTQLIYTAMGLIKLEGQAQEQSTLFGTRNGGKDWYSIQTLPTPQPGFGPAILIASPVSPQYFIKYNGHLLYSPTDTPTWQQIPGNIADSSKIYITPYLPLVVVSITNGSVSTLTFPFSDSRMHDDVRESSAPGESYFPQTGHNLSGLFQQYWETHGGLAQQGYPISEPFEQVTTAGTITTTFVTQYFERAVFEFHPENQPPYNVLLSLLGVAAYKERYGSAGAPGQQTSTDNPRYFSETGHTLGGKFRTYWETHGGLAQQGYPISDEFQEKSALDGKVYTVQYFERAVFELHPENAGTPYEVLLSQLGTAGFKARYPGLGAAPACQIDSVQDFGLVLHNNTSLAGALGCPISNPAQPAVQTAVEQFEHGSMLYVAQTGSTKYPAPSIFVMYDDGTYEQFNDTYVDGQPDTCSPAAPSGLFAPTRGFNKVWCGASGVDVRAKLGWALDSEHGGNGIWQQFANGVMYSSSASGDIYAFYQAADSGGAVNRFETYINLFR